MKFLLDVCAASRTLCRSLTDAGHDVLSASDRHANTADEELLALAFEQDRALVTKDKGFGKLVFVRRLPHPCVIRLARLSATRHAKVLHDLIEQHADAMRDRAIIVVTAERTRIRFLRPVGHDDD